MQRHELTDAQFKRLEAFLPANGGRGGQWRDHHQVPGAMFLRRCKSMPPDACRDR